MSAKAESKMQHWAFFSQHVILKRRRKCCPCHISYFRRLWDTMWRCL